MVDAPASEIASSVTPVICFQPDVLKLAPQGTEQLASSKAQRGSNSALRAVSATYSRSERHEAAHAFQTF